MALRWQRPSRGDRPVGTGECIRNEGTARMGEIIEVTSGPDRDWEHARREWAENLAAVGALFGDDEALMRAKANCLYEVLRRIVEEVPPLRVTAGVPQDLTAEHAACLRVALRAAALKGIEASMCHTVRVLTEAIYDLCTSKLRGRPS